MKNTKIEFSPIERDYINDTDFLLTKKLITDKIYDLFYQLTEILKNQEVHKNFIFPPKTDFKAGKITRGENYKGLPYIILDFPRLFDKKNIFAFRTMFWWGHYFSFTLHLGGPILKSYKNQILHNRKTLTNSGILFSNKSEWNHDLTDKHFLPVEKLHDTMLEESLQTGFIKFSRKIELKAYKELLKEGQMTYQSFLKLLS